MTLGTILLNGPNSLAQSIVADCVEAIVCKSLNGTIVGWNRAAEALFGYREAEVLGQSIQMLIPVDEMPQETAAMLTIASGKRLNEQHTVRLHKNGGRIEVNVTISPIRDRSGAIMGAATIIRKCHLPTPSYSDDELMRMAFRDPLTGLSNRNHMKERLQQAMRRDARTHQYCALLFIDLDDFKFVNDQAGHLTGDLVLVKAARRLEAHVREHDTVARWGGDEFIVLIEELGEQHEQALRSAQAVAHKLLRMLRRPYHCEQASYHCPPSIGLVCFRSGAAYADVIRQSDRAMYHAKRAGKGRVHADHTELQQPRRVDTQVVPTSAPRSDEVSFGKRAAAPRYTGRGDAWVTMNATRGMNTRRRPLTSTQ